MSFYVTHDQRIWLVHTEVGSGLTRVVFEELESPQESESLEGLEEE